MVGKDPELLSPVLHMRVGLLLQSPNKVPEGLGLGRRLQGLGLLECMYTYVLTLTNTRAARL